MADRDPGDPLSAIVMPFPGNSLMALAAQRRGAPLATGQQARLAALALLTLEAADVALFEANSAGEIVLANPAFLNLAAHHPQEAGAGWPPVAVSTMIQAVLGRQKAVTRPISLEIAGKTRHYWVRTVPIMDSEGNCVGVAGAFQNWSAELGRLNAAHQDQGRFRDFARASSDWFWEVDGDLVLTALSERVAGLLEQPASHFIGKPFTVLGEFEPNDAGALPFPRAMQTHQPFREQLFSMPTPDGEARLFHLSGVPLFDEQGRFRGFRGAGMDVTRQTLMEVQTQAAQRELESTLEELQEKNIALDQASRQVHAALDAKNDFLAAMSHELRTPLNAIIGFADAMQMQIFGDLAPHYVAYAHDIVGAGRHLLGLIDEVLDATTLESGDAALSLQSVALAPLVAQAVGMLQLKAQEMDLALVNAVLNPDLKVRADARRVTQILVNLLTNAVKFTPEGGSVGVESGEGDGWIDISVWDTGPGIAPEDQERVFEKFQQLGGLAYSGKPEGVGLGLHISRELARLMGGDLTLVSTPGKGARFTLALPLCLTDK